MASASDAIDVVMEEGESDWWGVAWAVVGPSMQLVVGLGACVCSWDVSMFVVVV